ncbi:MAG TPA: Pr6Pr family membrane protein [Lysobacter sp.]|jgi:hypothetical protein|nr:Pr6Pr family membrane protein [Lysobacter sp.]
MTGTNSKTRAFTAVIALIAAAVLVLQYVLLIRLTLDTVGPMFATVRFFTYFTILSNVLVLLTTGTCALAPQSEPAAFFARPVVRGGIALCIAVTMGIYATVLARLWQPQGAQWWADTGLHYAVPTLYLAWWLFAVPHGVLRWSDLLRWLSFPLVYVVWVFLRGSWVQEYPYPFLDLTAHDVATVLRNVCGVIVVFLIVGSMLVLTDHLLGRRRRVEAAT